MTQQMVNAQIMAQIAVSIAVLLLVTCLMYPIIRRKTERVWLWTLLCMVPFINTIAYMLILSKTDRDVLTRLKALEETHKTAGVTKQ